MSISDLAYAGLEQALNHHISMDQNAKAQMAQLHGRVIALEVLGTGQTIYLVPGPELTQLRGRTRLSAAGQPHNHHPATPPGT